MISRTKIFIETIYPHIITIIKMPHHFSLQNIWKQPDLSKEECHSISSSSYSCEVSFKLLLYRFQKIYIKVRSPRLSEVPPLIKLFTSLRRSCIKSIPDIVLAQCILLDNNSVNILIHLDSKQNKLRHFSRHVIYAKT